MLISRLRITMYRAQVLRRIRGLAEHLQAIPASVRDAIPSGLRCVATVSGSGPNPLACGKMQEHQAKIPKLPLPPFEQTVKTLDTVVRALCTDKEYEVFRAELDKFISGPGPVLHAALAKYDASKPDSTFVTEFWNQSYFTGRYPVVVNSNPFLKFRRPTRQLQMTQADFGARYSMAVAKIFNALYSHSYEPAVEFGRPMCMKQYANILATCRLPAKGQDSLSTVTSRDEGYPGHVIVMKGGNIFKLNVMKLRSSASGTPSFDVVSFPELKREFEAIIAASHPPGPDIGVFTSLERDRWADIRTLLLKSPINQASLKDIESALVVVCLDDYIAGSPEDEVAQLLYGPPIDTHAVNRWFDKFCVIVDPRGMSGANFEHSGFDGHSFKRLIEEAYFIPDGVDTGFPPVPETGGSISGTPATLLPFEVTPELRRLLADARADFDTRRANVNAKVSVCSTVSKNWLKEAKVYPDGFIQAAFQLTFRRLQLDKGVAPSDVQVPSVYESCSMRHYIDGRTETIRPVTPESLAFCKVYESPDSTVAAKKEALMKSVAAHAKRTKEAQSGNGIDRHMFAMACMGRLTDVGVPSLYATPAMQRLSRIDLSTSTIGGPATDMIGFGAVSETGYGIGYLVEPDHLKFTITCFNKKSDGSPTGNSGAELARVLNDVLTELKSLVSA